MSDGQRISYPRPMRPLLLALCLAGALLAASPATAGTGAATPFATLSLSKDRVAYGGLVVASGTVVPAVAGLEVVLELDAGESWSQVARTTTAADGSFGVPFKATAAGVLTAHVPGTEIASEAVPLSVTPRVRVRPGDGVAFVGGTVLATVEPASYSGRIWITVAGPAGALERVSAGVEGGKLRARVPAPGPGRLRVTLSFPSTASLDGLERTTRLTARARPLSVGTTGPDVRALARRLAELRFRVPGSSASFGWELYDSVIAFQKAHGLSRTGTVDTGTWRALARARPLRPRHRGPARHIEVDKTRQILLVVERGTVVAVLPVSSGATGNTPEGRHRIRWKAPSTTTWLGSGILYRTLTFSGNSFAIHGWPDVPAYPASHGCVRIPIWTADWLYDRSPVGETVYVYR